MNSIIDLLNRIEAVQITNEPLPKFLFIVRRMKIKLWEEITKFDDQEAASIITNDYGERPLATK